MLRMRRVLLGLGGLACVSSVFLLVAAPSPPQEAPEYVGTDFCAECHVEAYDTFKGTVHDDILDTEDGELGVGGCEACHGPGLLHVELASGEEPGFRDAIIGSPDPASCWQCHTDVRAQFSLPERHPVLQGFMSCSDCHNPHGTPNTRLLNDAGSQTCADCHADKEGPWVFPHAVNEVEGCVACHQPHGSVNAHLLPYKEIQFTCLQCHVDLPSFHDMPRQSDCLSCHSQIHGSNIDPTFRQ